MRLWLSAVDDHKEHAWMALYENDRDVIEDLLYHRLKKLWSDCTDPLAIFSKHIVGTEFCGQKVWEALPSAFPLNHKRMQTVLLVREFSRLMAWDVQSKADVDERWKPPGLANVRAQRRRTRVVWSYAHCGERKESATQRSRMVLLNQTKRW